MGERIGRHFARTEPRRRAVGYMRALLGDADRKNGWPLAERLGEVTPDGVQHLLARADWDADAVRDHRLAYVTEHLGDPGGVWIVDETGVPKKGTKSCGGARQDPGTAGRIENCQAPLRRRGEGAAGVRLGRVPDELARSGGVRPVGVALVECVGPDRGGGLRLRRPAGHHRSPVGPRRRRAVGDRGTCSSWLRATAGRTGTRCGVGSAGAGTSPSACSPWRWWR